MRLLSDVFSFCDNPFGDLGIVRFLTLDPLLLLSFCISSAEYSLFAVIASTWSIAVDMRVSSSTGSRAKEQQRGGLMMAAIGLCEAKGISS